jgi:hypothetical protein
MAIEIPSFIKEHPYTVGSIVIVGGIIVFYLLSGSSSSAGGATSNQSAILQADEAEAQINAGTQQANAQTSAQLQAAQDQQEETDEQTQASVNINNTNTAAQLAAAIYNTQGSVATTQSDNNAAIVEGANAEISNQNVYAMQESELEDQINSGVVENANNNATAVAGAQIQAGVSDLAIGDATTIAGQQTQDAYNLDLTNDEAYDAEIPYITQNAGDQKNSLIDATDQTGIFQTILSQGNPGVASVGTSASSSADKSANTTAVAQTASIASGLTSITNGLFG